MGKYSSRLIGGGTDPYVKSLKKGREETDIKSKDLPPSETGSGLLEMITGSKRETEETRTLPEFRETAPVQSWGKENRGMKLAAGLMFSLTDKDAQDVIKTAIPDAEFIKDEKGNVLVGVDGKYSVLNKPGFSKQDAVKAVTQFLSFIPAGKAAILGKGVLAKFGIGAAATAATEAGVQEIEKAAGAKKEREIGRIVTAGVMGGAAETIGPAWRGIKQSREAKKFQAAFEDIPDIAESVKGAGKAAEKVGIDLAYPQKAAVPSQLEEMQFVAQLPAGTKKAVQFLKKQNKQAGDAVEAYMTHLLPAEELTKATGRFKTASQKAVDAKKRIRSEATSPLYEKSFADKTPLDTSDIVTMIDDKITDFPETGEVSKKLTEIKSLVLGKKVISKEKPVYHGTDKIFDEFDVKKTGDGSIWFSDSKESIEKGVSGASGKGRIIERFIDENKLKLAGWYEYDKYSLAQLQDKGYDGIKLLDDGVTDYQIFYPEKLKIKTTKPIKGQQTLKKLHNSKLEIDQMLGKFGEDAMGNTTKREVQEIKKALVDFLEESSPDYKIARETFEKMSPDVTKMQESIIGQVSKLKDTQLKTISKRIFDPEETNVQTILNAKKAIQDVDPGAWDGLLRVELEKRLGKMATDIKVGDELIIDNIPGQLHRALFKPVKQKNILLASLDGEMKQNMIYLETALRRAGLGRSPGSPTAGREEIKKRLQGGIGQGIRNFIGAPLQKAGGAAVSLATGSAEEAAFNKRVRALAETLYNPEYKIQMSKIRKMNPNSAAALKSMTQLLNDINEMTE